MNKIIIAIVTLLTSICHINHIQGQDLESIISSHLKAVTQDKRGEIRSLLLEVQEVHEDGDYIEYSIIKKKPNKIRIEGVWQDKNYIKAFDGTRAWTIAPWTGIAIPQLMTHLEMEDITSIDRIDSPMYESQQNGYKMSLIEDKMIDGKPYYCIRMEPDHQPAVDYLVDKNDFLIYKSMRYENGNIQSLLEEVYYKDYSNKGDVVMPMSYEVRRDGKSVDVIIKEIILGFGAPSSFFKKPE